MATRTSFIDLTERPPRSFRVRLGNYVILARMLDKGRATLAGKNGEYKYNSGTEYSEKDIYDLTTVFSLFHSAELLSSF